jgi:probable O-glycosylation ligase (exosortase A-associated)
MRTIFVLLITAGFLRYAFKGPFYVLLFYLWLAYFRPEQWVWTGFVSSLNLQLFVGGWLVLFTIISSQRQRIGVGNMLLFLLMFQGMLSAWMSPSPTRAWGYWEEFAKTLLISHLIVVLITTEQRLRVALIVIALSLSAEAAKQGWAQLFLNPGGRNDNTHVMLGDNNGVAVGMCMLLALLFGLMRTASGRLERYTGRFLGIGITYRAISTYSRGGFISLAVVLLHYILHSRRKVAGLVAVGLVAALILPELPDAFWARMRTLESLTEGNVYIDGSAAGRIHFWRTAFEMAHDRPLVGVGQNSFILSYSEYDRSNGMFGSRRDVHSSWLGMLSELGYPGFFLYVLLLATGFYNCWRARRLARRSPDLKNLGVYATAVEGALLVATVGGTFVTFQYNEMLWHTIALSMVIHGLVRERVTVPRPATAPIRVPQTALAR